VIEGVVDEDVEGVVVVVKVIDLVEKLVLEEVLSNLVIIGWYVLYLVVFEVLWYIEFGCGGEI